MAIKMAKIVSDTKNWPHRILAEEIMIFFFLIKKAKIGLSPLPVVVIEIKTSTWASKVDKPVK